MVKERIENTEAFGRALNIIFNKLARQNTAFWLEKFEHYNSLPKARSKERKIASGLLTETVEGILQNPQEISFMQEALTNKKNNALTQDAKQQFVQLVRDNCLTLIKDKWDDVMPEQLAQLVRIHANNDPSQDDAREMLRNYFRGPKSRNQRIEAYYAFVSATLDLKGEDEAFEESMKIVLHATDILPKNPSLLEQTGLLSFPYGEEESVFKKLLIARSIVAQIRFIGSWDLDKYYEDRGNFILTDSVAITEGNKRQGNVIRKIGENEARGMYDRMKATMRLITSGSIESLPEERKQELMGTWPFNLALDETDPLNQKFQKVFSSKR